jgi:hypothetical protein
VGRQIEGDLTIPSFEARPCRRLVPGDDPQTVVAHVMHGVWQGVHHVEVCETEEEVTVTAHVGTLPAVAERQAGGEELLFVMKGVIRIFRIELSASLGTRRLCDGAAAAGAGGRPPDGMSP